MGVFNMVRIGYPEKSMKSLTQWNFNPSFLLAATMTALLLKWGSKVSISRGFSPALRNSVTHSLKITSRTLGSWWWNTGNHGRWVSLRKDKAKKHEFNWWFENWMGWYNVITAKINCITICWCLETIGSWLNPAPLPKNIRYNILQPIVSLRNPESK